jgi:hypothetical protein
MVGREKQRRQGRQNVETDQYVAIDVNNPVVKNNNRLLYKVTRRESCIIADYYS